MKDSNEYARDAIEIIKEQLDEHLNLVLNSPALQRAFAKIIDIAITEATEDALKEEAQRLIRTTCS